MCRLLVIFSFLLVLPMALAAQSIKPVISTNFPFYDSQLPIEQRVDDLLMRLTLEEKISLMEHQNPAIERLALPAYSWWNEALHGVARNGYAHVYPMPIALAATFDVDLIEKTYQAIAIEARQKHYKDAVMSGIRQDYTGLTFFTPNINIFRDPRWGRGMETFGEDPYLTARMGLAVVQGLQGRDTTKLVTAACLKHLAVHSGPEGVRHEFDARVSPRDLWTTYLPAFEYIIKHSNVQQVMCGYNRLNGVPCCTNRDLLVDILRNKWNYNNILVTDCWALNDCWERDTVIPRHKTHPSAAHTAGDAFGSEVDLECGSGLPALKAAVDSGYIDESKIDDHLRRILRTRLMVGVDDPNADTAYLHIEDPFVDLHGESIVMLKRSQLTPLNGKKTKRIAVVGPNAADSIMLQGNYNGTPRHAVTILEGMQHWAANQHVDPVTLYYHPLCDRVNDTVAVDRSVWDDLKKNDVIIFVGGLSPELEGEELPVELDGFHKGDRTSIELPKVQQQMIREIRKRTGKPVVLVLCCGSAIALGDIEKELDGIYVAWYGGETMGLDVANALTCHHFSFGRLPLTFYRSTEQMPPFDDYSMKGRTYRYMTERSMYPFGYGLSYRQFKLKDLRFDDVALNLTGTVVDPHPIRGKALPTTTVVQVYLRNPNDPEGPIKSLVGFTRVRVYRTSPEGTPFSIVIDPDWLRTFDEQTQQMGELTHGLRYELQVGFSSDDKDLITIPFEY